MSAGRLLGIILHVISEETQVKIKKTLTECIPATARAGHQRKPGCSRAHRPTATWVPAFRRLGGAQSSEGTARPRGPPTAVRMEPSRRDPTDPDENPVLLTFASEGKSGYLAAF